MRKLRGARSRPIGAVRDAAGSILVGQQAKDEVARRVELWFKAKPPPSMEEKQQLESYWAVPGVPQLDQLLRPITLEEVSVALQGVSNSSAPGWSQFPVVALKAAGPEGQQLLADQLNKLLDGKALPDHWSEGEMVLVFKSSDRLVPENYRPLVMLEATYKLFTKVMEARLRSALDQSPFWAENQSGFRAKRDTALNAAILMGLIDKAAREKSELHLAFLDWKKAFDSVPIWAIELALKGIGLPPKALKLFCSLYEHNVCHVRTEFGHTGEVDLAKGVRQGDPLLPPDFLYGDKSPLERVGYNRGRARAVAIKCECPCLCR